MNAQQTDRLYRRLDTLSLWMQIVSLGLTAAVVIYLLIERSRLLASLS